MDAVYLLLETGEVALFRYLCVQSLFSFVAPSPRVLVPSDMQQNAIHYSCQIVEVLNGGHDILNRLSVSGLAARALVGDSFLL